MTGPTPSEPNSGGAFARPGADATFPAAPPATTSPLAAAPAPTPPNLMPTTHSAVPAPHDAGPESDRRALQGPLPPQPGALAPGDSPSPGASDGPPTTPGDADADSAPVPDAPVGFETPNHHGPFTGALLALIGGYKRFLSPAMPPACRFLPTCSEYGYEAVARYGIIRGGRMALWRILRCNPFGRGGVDPVP